MKVLFIVSPINYQPQEYQIPKKILEEAGIKVITASKEKGKCIATDNSTTEATLALKEVKVSDYEAIVFVGGSGMVKYQQDKEMHFLAQETVNQNKILAAICISPTILAQAQVLKGKKATSWDDGQSTQIKLLEEKGAKYTGEEVTIDGKIITAKGPKAAEKFGKAILAKLKEG